MLTAGHCIYNQSTNQFSDDFTLYGGRNGTSNLASVFVDNDNIPPGENLWYWVPSGWLNDGGRENDVGILVIPEDFGEQVGFFDGQSWFGYVSYSATALQSQTYWNRGYAACDPTFTGGVARIDEPCQTGTWDPYQSCTAKPCNANHLYGDSSSCSVGELESLDGSGYYRILHHGCDASGGQSGAPFYRWDSNLDDWVVAGLHTGGDCGITALNCPDSPDPLYARPGVGIRLTPSYVGSITYFRNQFP